MTTKAKRVELTQADILAGYERNEWGGWGYLGERRYCSTSPAIGLADGAILDVANSKGWDADQLFQFLNSKIGRWFADMTIGSHLTDVEAIAKIAASYVR